MARDRDKPSFANDVDGPRIPSIETTPGTIPQTPLPDAAPSRPQSRAKPRRKGRTQPEPGGNKAVELPFLRDASMTCRRTE